MTVAQLPCEPFSDGEIAFFRRFIREPMAGRNGVLKLAVERWGFCARHTFGLLVVSASIPRSGLSTTALLYQQITSHCIAALERCSSLDKDCVEILRDSEPCPMCELGLDEDSPGVIHRDWLTLPKSLGRFRAMLEGTREQWSSFVCRACVEGAIGASCRVHAIRALETRIEHETVRGTLEEQQRLLQALRSRLERYVPTFSPDNAGVDAGEGVAALIIAAGWCTGWRILLLALDEPLGS